ncbi:MAG: hypothetical protein FWF99_03290 [Desulfovibrionaceae bacterium]|nr:hypothetical protein [Desulfovibrionaceae bacterium]
MRGVVFSCVGDFSCSREEMREELMSFVAGLELAIYADAISNSHSDGNILEAGVFFVSSPPRFRLLENRLLLEVDSSMTGPGYHVAMLNFMESLEEGTSLRWDRGTLRDDTGYYEHRDFKRLQNFMRDWLLEYSRELLSSPLERDQLVRVNLTMPYTMRPRGYGGKICHSIGCFDRDFFTALCEMEEKDLVCRAFFIWWEEGLNPEFYLKCALNLIWCHINWLPPELDREMAKYSLALKSLDLAWQGCQDMDFPVPEWIEIAELTHNKELAGELLRRFPTGASQPPAKGFRRHDLLHTLGENNWRIALPGRMHRIFNEEGTLFWDDRRRSISISTSHSLGADGRPLPAATLLENSLGGLPAERRDLPLAPEVPAYILHEEGESCSTTLFAAQSGHLVVVDVKYPASSQRAWATALCDTLTAI